LGAAGLVDRSCRPHKLHRPTQLEQLELVEQLRRQRWTGLRIAQQTGLSRATVSRMRDLEPPRPINRYEHPNPGDMLHLDIKKLGRIAKPGHRVTGNLADRTRRVGWEYVHVAIDDHSRIAFKAVLTDNGPAYRSRAFAAACRQLALKYRFTRPYTPPTNGKAERFIRTALQGVGLRANLPQLRPENRTTPSMAARIQLAQATR